MTMRMLLPIRKVAERIGRGKSWIRAEKKREDSDFPKPVELDGYVRAVWDSEEVDAWIARSKRRIKIKARGRSLKIDERVETRSPRTDEEDDGSGLVPAAFAAGLERELAGIDGLRQCMVAAVEELERALSELLRLYDWRNELGRIERDENHDRKQMKKWLNQYGREKQAAWAVARVLLDAAPQADGQSVAIGTTVAGEAPAVAAPDERSLPSTPR